MLTRENRGEVTHNLETGHSANEDTLELSAIERCIWGDPHPPSKILAIRKNRDKGVGQTVHFLLSVCHVKRDRKSSRLVALRALKKA